MRQHDDASVGRAVGHSHSQCSRLVQKSGTRRKKVALAVRIVVFVIVVVRVVAAARPAPPAPPRPAHRLACCWRLLAAGGCCWLLAAGWWCFGCCCCCHAVLSPAYYCNDYHTTIIIGKATSARQGDLIQQLGAVKKKSGRTSRMHCCTHACAHTLASG